MREIICQPKEEIANFVRGIIGEHLPFENFSTIALLDDSRILAGIVYNHYSVTNICMHVGAIPGRHWLNPDFLFAAFDYPFGELNLRRVTGLVPAKNLQARRFDENLGFKLEGCMKDALSDDDMLVYGMLRKDCKWISSEFCGRLQKRALRRLPASSLAMA